MNINPEAHYVVYATDTGQIIRMGIVPESMVSIQAGEGESVMVVDAHPAVGTKYVQDGEIVTRPTLPDPDKTTILADGEDMATFIVPNGTVVKIGDDVVGTVDDGAFQFSADVADIYHVSFTQAHPYQNKTFIIQAIL